MSRSKRARNAFLAGLLLFTLITFPGETRAATDEKLRQSIDRLTTAIEQLAKSQQTGTQSTQHDDLMRRLSLAVAYLDYRSRRIEALEMERSEIHTSLERFEDFIRSIERREEAIDENLRNNPQASRAETEQSRKELEDQKKMMTERIARGDSKLIQLDNEITALKSQLVPIERFIQENLQF